MMLLERAGVNNIVFAQCFFWTITCPTEHEWGHEDKRDKFGAPKYPHSPGKMENSFPLAEYFCTIFSYYG
jgi:hypothetical protein